MGDREPLGLWPKQLFGRVAPFYRPQERMFTTGQEQVLRECGVDGLLFYYALVPFNTLAAFVPALPLQQRFNPFWFRTREDQPPLIVFPCLSTADLLEFGSLENLMLDLHDRQQRGEIPPDVLIQHQRGCRPGAPGCPSARPWLFSWFPNTGGPEEYIAVVNKSSPGGVHRSLEYLATHPPQGEVLPARTYDGALDGNHSWLRSTPARPDPAGALPRLASLRR